MSETLDNPKQELAKGLETIKAVSSLRHDTPAVAGLSTDQYDVVSDLKSRTDMVAHGLSQILYVHNAPQGIIRDMKLRLSKALNNLDSESMWLKYMKYILAYPLAKYLKNEPPKNPGTEFFFSQKGERNCFIGWLKQRLTVFNRKNTHLMYSWYQAKRCSLPASETMVEAAYQEHFDTLTKADVGKEDVINKIFNDKTFQSVLEKVRDSVDNHIGDVVRAFDKRTPSTSACFDHGRSEGGQQQSLRALAELDTDWDDVNCDYVNRHCDYSPELHSMKLLPIFHTRNGVYYNIVKEVYYFPSYNWDRLRELKSSYSLVSNLNCTIQAILEPMKIRIISKGESLPYYSMKPLQKIIHSCMRKMSCFRLLGKSICPTDLIDLKKKAMSSWKWFSIDYSAATDNLSYRYSGRIFRYLIGGLPDLERWIANRVLGPHMLHYPKLKNRARPIGGLQSSGQLMGSILSFPILCLANLGVYLLNTQQIQKDWTEEDRINHVLVNGDDMLYAAGEDLWQSHIDISAAIGLKMSVGKAYIHDTYANINSVSYHYPLARKYSRYLNKDTLDEIHREVHTSPIPIDFLNVGLLNNIHKVQGEVSQEISESDEQISEIGICDDVHFKNMNVEQMDRFSKFSKAKDFEDFFKPKPNFVTNINKIMEGSLPGEESRRRLFKMILEQNSDLINRDTKSLIRCGRGLSKKNPPTIFTRNLFIPIALGGCGVKTPTADWQTKHKKIQLRLASYLLRDKGIARHSMFRPLPGYEVERFESQLIAPWQNPGKVIECGDEVLDYSTSKIKKGTWIFGSEVCLWSHSQYSYY